MPFNTRAAEAEPFLVTWEAVDSKCPVDAWPQKLGEVELGRSVRGISTARDSR